MLKIIFLSLSLIINMVSKDTLMEAFYNDRIYYNLAVDDNGEVLVSSNAGVFKVEGSRLKNINKNHGYISIKNGYISYSKFTNEEMHSKYNHLLPDYYRGFNHFSLEKDPYIYLISNNSFFIFKLSDYKTYMPESSIRAFSANSIGTYDGIYCYGKKIKVPDYTSGNILEQDSTFYICYDGLAIYKPNDSIQLFKRDLTGEVKICQNYVGLARDIFKLNDGRFILATTKGLYILNSTFTSIEKILEEESENGTEIIYIDQQQETLVVTFSINNSLYEYSLVDDELVNLSRFDKSIEDGFKIEGNKKKYIILTDNEIFSVSDGINERIIFDEFSDSYSLLPFDKGNVIITTMDGAFAINLNTKKTTEIFQGVEFNKRALFKTADSIKLGTINGYVSLSTNELKNMIKEVDSFNDIKRNNTFFITLIGVLVIVVLLSIAFYLISLKRKQSINNKTTLNDIETFIISNLNQVTIDSIINNFNLSLKELYELTYPNKPGKLITKKRKDLVKTLLRKDKDLVYISELTGFSISYLKKIKGSLT